MTDRTKNTDYARLLFDSTSLTSPTSEVWFAVKPQFIEDLEVLLDDFGIAAQLNNYKQQGQKATGLGIGCEEGIPTSFIAESLQKRGLLDIIDI